MPFMFIAKTFDNISKITGRIHITALLANMFRTIIAAAPDDLLHAVYLCTNRVRAARSRALGPRLTDRTRLRLRTWAKSWAWATWC
jgi:hypothetical protein